MPSGVFQINVETGELTVNTNDENLAGEYTIILALDVKDYYYSTSEILPLLITYKVTLTKPPSNDSELLAA